VTRLVRGIPRREQGWRSVAVHGSACRHVRRRASAAKLTVSRTSGGTVGETRAPSLTAGGPGLLAGAGANFFNWDLQILSDPKPEDLT
jgi:hypothetical protein